MIFDKKANPYQSSIVGYWPFKSDLNSRTTGVSAATITRASTGHFITGNGTLSSKGNNVARFETRGVLLESPSQNEAIYSNDLYDSIWITAGGSTEVVAGFPDPKGGTDAFRITFLNSGVTFFSQTTAASIAASSIWMKAETDGTEVLLSTIGSPTTTCVLSTNWKRFFAIGGGSGILIGNNFSGGEKIYAYNPQAEECLNVLDCPTTDIITSATPVARSGDLLSLPSSVIPNITASFAVAADVIIKCLPPSASSIGIIKFIGETNGRIVTVDENLNITVSYGGVSATTVSPPLTQGCRARFLFTGNNSAWKLFINGVQALTGSVGGSGAHTRVDINDGLKGVIQVRDIIGYNRYFSTSAEALLEYKFHD